MKVTGAELTQWMKEAWPGGFDNDDWFWDHDAFEEFPDPTATYDTEEIGGIFYQGDGADPTKGEGYDLTGLVRAWRKQRTHEDLVFSVPRDKANAVRAAVAAVLKSKEAV